MYRMQLGFALAAAIGTGTWWAPEGDFAPVHAVVQAATSEPA